MCNRARYDDDPETLWGSAAKLFGDRPMDNRFDPKELRPKASIVYKATGNLCAVQLLLGRSKIENTVRYPGVDIEDPLTLAVGTAI